MGIMGIFMRFPGGKSKALTLSYDDGVRQDRRLLEIMKRHGLKGTFNLNSGRYAPEEGTTGDRLSRSEAVELFSNCGMEIAVHSMQHPYLEQLPENLCTYEVLQDRKNLEEEYGRIIRGMAYPFGTTSDSVVASLKQCGIAYARTTVSTEGFAIPKDWLRLPTTCHHKNPRLMELAREFAENEFDRGPALFYLWGHSYEFDFDLPNSNWGVIEEFADYMGGREDIWYATNIEIYDYVSAYNQLIFSMDYTRVYNPSCTTVHFKTKKGLYTVKPGETICYEFR